MSSCPQVSVVMPAFNAANTIRDAVKSVVEQTFQDWELIVVNDGSTDQTMDVISQFDDERIKLITQVNQGVAAARNAGMRLARGEYIAFLDSDDLWLPTKLEKQISLFEKCEKRVGLVYTKHRGFTETPLNAFSMDVDVSIGYDNSYHRLLIMDYIPTLSVMIRASLVTDVGFFREDLQGTEDWDYWIRIAKLYDVMRVNEELALYRISLNSLSRNKDRHSLEELKVLNLNLKSRSESDIPEAVRHMAWLFWYAKKIRYQLPAGRIRDIVHNLRELSSLRPFYFRNYFLVLIWSISYALKRHILRAFKK